MLNAYWAEVVPVVAAEDGMIERFAGDAVMVVFNAATDQPDHRDASRARGARLRESVRGGRAPADRTGRASASGSTAAPR